MEDGAGMKDSDAGYDDFGSDSTDVSADSFVSVDSSVSVDTSVSAGASMDVD